MIEAQKKGVFEFTVASSLSAGRSGARKDLYGSVLITGGFGPNAWNADPCHL